MTAAAFMASFSTAGRAVEKPKACEPSRFTVVDRWNGERFVEVELEWDGTMYREVR
jgi:hypothetical protein